METLFAPPDQEWHPISPSYKAYDRLGHAVWWILLSTVPAVIVGLTSGLWWISAIIWAAGLAVLVSQLILVERRWRAWGYALRNEDLYITHGVMFRKLTAVPYGRMQVVEVTSGPIMRMFNLATVKLVTASAQTDAQIVGLPPERAAELRDQLTSLGESQASGL
ncbi:PH domain-containing protein [Propionibacteriaceae bacterium Y1685]|uniref:PH domain-containing protein n=1 Tax=Microlunatus sp. Y1700 TaxID=3418487 RepID=UPI003B7F3B2A